MVIQLAYSRSKNIHSLEVHPVRRDDVSAPVVPNNAFPGAELFALGASLVSVTLESGIRKSGCQLLVSGSQFVPSKENDLWGAE